jgi:hypothetical protein
MRKGSKGKRGVRHNEAKKGRGDAKERKNNYRKIALEIILKKKKGEDKN